MQKDRQETDSEPGRAGAVMQIALSKPVFAGLIGLILLPWVIVITTGIVMLGRSGTVGGLQNRAVGNTERIASRTNSVREEAVGPWGVLEIDRMLIDLPSSMNSFDFDPEPYRSWALRDTTIAGARQMFMKAGVAGNDVDAILKTASENTNVKGITVRPPENIVRGFPPKVRAALYRELSHDPGNIGQAEPFVFLGDTIDEWFLDSKIPANTIEAIRPLVYKQGNYLLFSDPQLVLPGIESRYERLKLFGVLHRTSTLRLRLKARNEDEEAAIVDYWGYPNRHDEIEPLMTAVAMKSHGLPISLFLPVFARNHLYTYIQQSQFHDGLNRDCHWASFNFFNDPPDNRFAVGGTMSTTVPEEYEAVNAPTRLGDVILIFDGNHKLIHSCVYIADDIVFTKNGMGEGVPLILDKMDNVVSFYMNQYGGTGLAFCRKKAAVLAGKPRSS